MLLPLTSPSVSFPFGNFCEVTSWVKNGSIRLNLLDVPRVVSYSVGLRRICMPRVASRSGSSGTLFGGHRKSSSYFLLCERIYRIPSATLHFQSRSDRWGDTGRAFSTSWLIWFDFITFPSYHSKGPLTEIHAGIVHFIKVSQSSFSLLLTSARTHDPWAPFRSRKGTSLKNLCFQPGVVLFSDG